jgi:50S ribosomal protein L16 3-hydroxylase
MLYLPPHFAHHGVALNDCMTFSVGFRAPSSADMMDAITNTIIEQGFGSMRYADLDLQAANNSSEIDNDAIKRLKQLLHDTIDNAEPVLAQALGKFVTETKSTLTMLAQETITELPTVDEITIAFEQGNHLQRSPYHRFAWSKHNKEVQLFVAGEAYTATLTSIDNIILLAECTTLSQNDWQRLCQDQQSASLLCQLIAEGAWYWTS